MGRLLLCNLPIFVMKETMDNDFIDKCIDLETTGKCIVDPVLGQKLFNRYVHRKLRIVTVRHLSNDTWEITIPLVNEENKNE